MAPVTLPPSFFNSFWSADYRTGLDVLFRQLESGCDEAKEIAEFIESQARAHHNMAATLLDPPLGANHPSTSSLQHTLLSLRGASAARGEAHRALAMELQEHVLMPFNGWRARHEGRVDDARDAMLGRSGVVASWEKEAHKLSGLRQTYISKSRQADDSEDDAKFAPPTVHSPTSSTQDNYTLSPQPKHTGAAASLRRTGTVADRINAKLRAASVQRPSSIDEKSLPPMPHGDSPARQLPALSRLQPAGPVASLDSPSSPREEAFIPPTGPHGEPTLASAIGQEDGAHKGAPVFVILAGASLPEHEFKQLLQRFDNYLSTNVAPGTQKPSELSARAVNESRQRSTILGTYEKTFSGDEIVQWLSHNVSGLKEDHGQCVEAADELLRMGHLSRVGVGRGFEPDDETFYVLKLNPGDGSVKAQLQNFQMPTSLNMPAMPAIPSMSSPMAQSATSHIPSFVKNYLPAGLGSDEPAHVRHRRDAQKASANYQSSVREAENSRLEMEERIERGLRQWEQWERERLRVVGVVLKHYESALHKLPQRLAGLQEGTSLAVEAYNPDADLKALIEGSRTGPFRPRPHIYESVESDLPDVNFGIDLRRWSGETAWSALIKAPPRAKDAIPEVLQALLTAINELGSQFSEDDRRKSWIYEVPLEETHALRNDLNNSQLTVDDMVTISKRHNVPVIAGTVKLWFLELNPPVMGWEGWEDAKAIYPTVGADQERDMTSAVTSVLGTLHGSQLFTLNAIVKHWKDLIASTKSDKEDDTVYTTKLALSLGRCILRPQQETELTIQDRTPGLFLADLLEHYDAVFPDLVEKKKTQADRVMPTRKRTTLVDQRISRSRLSEGGVEPQQLLEQQHALTHPPQQQQQQPQIQQQQQQPAPAQPTEERPTVGSAPTSRFSEPSQKLVPPPMSVASASDDGAFVTPPMTSPTEEREEPFIPPTGREAPPFNATEDMEEPFIPPTETTPRAAPSASRTSQYSTGQDDFRTSQYSIPDRTSSYSIPEQSFRTSQHLQDDYSIPPVHTGTPPNVGSRTGLSEPGPASPGGRASPAARILEDEVVAPGGTGGLKRNTSNEASRLRGPRGARGPRPAPGGGGGHRNSGSVSALAAQFESK